MNGYEKRIQEEIPKETREENTPNIRICHLILAALAGWCPSDQRAGEYYRRRQEIFRMAQPYFQPAALSFVTKQGQQDYLLERDFLAYHSEKISKEWVTPLELLRKLLEQYERRCNGCPFSLSWRKGNLYRS